MEALLLHSVLWPRVDRAAWFPERVNTLTPAMDTLMLLAAVTKPKDESEEEHLPWEDTRDTVCLSPVSRNQGEILLS
jgi:hypothetical protein